MTDNKQAEWTERQVRASMGENAKKFSCLKFQCLGSCPEDPDDLNSAYVDFRIFVQTKDPSVMGISNMASMSGASFTRWCMENFLQSCPGASVHPDLRQASAKQIYEYWPALIPQSVVKHKALLEW